MRLAPSGETRHLILIDLFAEGNRSDEKERRSKKEKKVITT